MTAFLKAFDLQRVLSQNGHRSNPMLALTMMTSAFEFERTVLHSAKRMDRVIQILGDGDVYVEQENAFSWVPNIIFEKADADFRQHLRNTEELTVSRRLQLLHHVATGLQQLHNGKIVHQDLKPSNILVWQGTGAKIGDLGRCSLLGSVNANDNYHFAGGLLYATPETLYNFLNPDWNERRLPIDLFLFGSLVVFMFTQESMPSLMLGTFLLEEHRPRDVWDGQWTGTFAEVLPYLEESFAKAMMEFERNLPAPRTSMRDYRPRLIQIVADMCHPDPARRGTLVKKGDRTRNLGRVVTALNALYYDA